MIRDIRFVGTDELIIFWKFHNFPWNIVAVARLGSYFVVGSLDLTWWPDLIWHWVDIFTKVVEKMGGKVGENPAALRVAGFSLSSKTWGGGRSNVPPAGRGLRSNWFYVLMKQKLIWNLSLCYFSLFCFYLPGYDARTAERKSDSTWRTWYKQTARVYHSRRPISWLIPETQYPVIYIIKFWNN